MLEKDLQKKVISDIKQLRSTYYFKKQASSIRGTPDIIICCRGCFIALELKRDEKGKATALQELALLQILNSGGIGVIVTPENWEILYGKLMRLSKGEKDVQTELQDLALRLTQERANKGGVVERLQKYKLFEESGGDC